MKHLLVYADSLSWGIVPGTRQRLPFAEHKCAGPADALRQVAGEHGCAFFDAADATPASHVDGIYLDADQHGALAEAIAPVVVRLLRGDAASDPAGHPPGFDTRS